MTNYNDGNWHGWNGGECPVNRRTTVDVVWLYGGDDAAVMYWSVVAGDVAWRGYGLGAPVAFRVVKEHREPREWWVSEASSGRIGVCPPSFPGAFKVREVIE